MFSVFVAFLSSVFFFHCACYRDAVVFKCFRFCSHVASLFCYFIDNFLVIHITHVLYACCANIARHFFFLLLLLIVLCEVFTLLVFCT